MKPTPRLLEPFEGHGHATMWIVSLKAAYATAPLSFNDPRAEEDAPRTITPMNHFNAIQRTVVAHARSSTVGEFHT